MSQFRKDFISAFFLLGSVAKLAVTGGRNESLRAVFVSHRGKYSLVVKYLFKLLKVTDGRTDDRLRETCEIVIEGVLTGDVRFALETSKVNFGNFSAEKAFENVS